MYSKRLLMFIAALLAVCVLRGVAISSPPTYNAYILPFFLEIRGFNDEGMVSFSLDINGHDFYAFGYWEGTPYYLVPPHLFSLVRQVSIYDFNENGMAVGTIVLRNRAVVRGLFSLESGFTPFSKGFSDFYGTLRRDTPLNREGHFAASAYGTPDGVQGRGIICDALEESCEDLPFPILSGNWNAPEYINDSGDVAGTDFNTEGAGNKAFLYNGEEAFDLHPDGYEFSFARGLANDGSVLVYSRGNFPIEPEEYSFIWNDGLITPLLPPEGVSCSSGIAATNMSNDGRIIVATCRGNDVSTILYFDMVPYLACPLMPNEFYGCVNSPAFPIGGVTNQGILYYFDFILFPTESP